MSTRLSRSGYYTDFNIKNQTKEDIILRIKREGRLQQNMGWDITYHINGNMVNWTAVST